MKSDGREIVRDGLLATTKENGSAVLLVMMMHLHGMGGGLCAYVFARLARDMPEAIITGCVCTQLLRYDDSGPRLACLCLVVSFALTGSGGPLCIRSHLRGRIYETATIDLILFSAI